MNHRIASLLLVAAAGGCVDQPADQPGEAREPSALGLQRRGGGNNPCPDWGCGANSPVVDSTKGFHELNLDGEPNNMNMSLHDPAIMLNDRPFTLSIEDNRFVGRGDDGTVISGAALVGAEILIDTPDAAPAYKISIESVRIMDYPFPNTVTRDQTEAYILGWRVATAPPGSRGSYSNICSNPPPDGGPRFDDFSELLGMKPPEVVIFSNDRIDAAAKKVRDEAFPRWFNLGCATHALAKLHLTRNTLGSASPSVAAPSQEKRQATLKLLVADYCGTGYAFTVAGQPLQWKGHENDPANYYFDSIRSLEARWNETGATCLNEPRLEKSTLKSARELYPTETDVWEDIKYQCATIGRDVPQSCGGASPEFYGNDLRVSANPGTPPADPASADPAPADPAPADPPWGFSRFLPRSRTRFLVPL